MNKKLVYSVFTIFIAGAMFGKILPSSLPFVQAGNPTEKALDLLARNNPKDVEALVELYNGCKKEGIIKRSVNQQRCSNAKDAFTSSTRFNALHDEITPDNNLDLLDIQKKSDVSDSKQGNQKQGNV
jgi:hypothetical protein